MIPGFIVLQEESPFSCRGKNGKEESCFYKIQCHGPALNIHLSPYIDKALRIMSNNYKLGDHRFIVITLALSVMESGFQYFVSEA